MTQRKTYKKKTMRSKRLRSRKHRSMKKHLVKKHRVKSKRRTRKTKKRRRKGGVTRGLVNGRKGGAGDDEKPYIIAEAGLNHNGNLNLAKKLIDEAYKEVKGVKWLSTSAWDPCHLFTVKKKVTSLADMKGLRVFGVPTAGKFLSRYGLIPVIVPWDDVETAMQTGELDGVCWCGFTEAYEVGWADICKYALTNAVTGAWFGSYFANSKSWEKLSPKLQALYRMSINDSHYYRQVWYWGGEADLRVNGKKMELTSLPANEWGKVVEDSKEFWDDTSKISPRAKKVVDAFKLYAQTMEKAGYPYR